MSRMPQLFVALGQRERTVIVGAFVAALFSIAFGAIAGEVVDGDTRAIDDAVLSALRDPAAPDVPIGPRYLRTAAMDLTALGSVTVVALVTLASVGWLVLRGRPRAAALVAFASLGGALLSTALKHWFGRERPAIVPHLVEVASASFPSGHAMMSAVVYLTLGALLADLERKPLVRGYVLACAFTLTLLVGLTRIYLGVHHPTDVIAGWCAGLAWASAALVLSSWLRRRGMVARR